MPSLDLRPGHLDITLRPGNTHSIALQWDEALAGRTFTAEMGATALVVDVNDNTDEITVTISDEITATLDRTAAWTVTETTIGEPQVVVAGRLQPSNSGSSSQSSTVAVSTQTATVTVTPIASPYPGAGDIDGGSPSSTYLASQVIDGGTP